MSKLSVSSEQLLQNLILETESNKNDIQYNLLKYILQIINNYSIDSIAQYDTIVIILTTVVILSFIRYIFPRKLYNIDWCSLVHAIVTTIGSLVCFYLDTTYYKYADTNNTNSSTVNLYLSISEPTRTIQYCTTTTTTLSLSSIHTIIPAITVGYSILDIIHGITLGYDFIFHGIITFISVYYMVIICNTPSRMSSMLFMEFSTIFLCYKDTTLFNNTMKTINMICFIIAFFICRIVIVPYIWYNLLIEISINYTTKLYQQCFPSHYYNTILICGILFHCLNSFWMYKIIQKVIRIINGTDGKRTSTSTNNNDNKEQPEERKKKQN